MTSPDLPAPAQVLFDWLNKQGKSDFQKASLCTNSDCLALMEAHKDPLAEDYSTSLLVLCSAIRVLVQAGLLQAYTLVGYDHVRLNQQPGR